MAHDVFISHSSKDKPIADAICAKIEAAGVRCWIAPRDIAPGEDWPAAITRGISQSHIMVLVFSSHSNSSEEVSRELFLAANSKLVIIPFKIENIEPEPGKQYYLARTHWLDAINPPTQEQIQQLVSRVKVLVPPREPEFIKQTDAGLPPATTVQDDQLKQSVTKVLPDSTTELAPNKSRLSRRFWLVPVGVILICLLGWTAFSLFLKNIASPIQPTTFPTFTSLTSTSMPISSPIPIPTSTLFPTPTSTSIPTPTPMPYAIQDAVFQDYEQDCDTDVNITSVDGDSLGITVNTTITMLNGGWALFCYGAKHTWIDTLTYKGFTFASDESDPLEFMVDQYRGYVYVHGKGVVTLPDGTQVTLPSGEGSGAVTKFSADFNDASFDGSFDLSQWTYQSDYPNISIKQTNGAMVLSKPSASGMESGNLKTNQTWSLGEVSYVEVRLKLDQEHTGEMGNAGFSIGDDFGNDVGCSVQIQGQNTTPFIWCAQSHIEADQQWIADYMSNSYFIEYDKWYKASIEFNSRTNEFKCYIDDELFFSWQPTNIDDLLGNKFSVSVGVWADNGTAITGYVDDIRIVK